MKYKLIRCGFNQLSELEDEVNTLLDSGWVTVGELKAVTVDRQLIFIQQLEQHNLVELYD